MESFGKDQRRASLGTSYMLNRGRISTSPNGYSTPITSQPFVKPFPHHNPPWDAIDTRSDYPIRPESMLSTPKGQSMIYSTVNKDTESARKSLMTSMSFQEELYTKLKNVAAENETILDEMKEMTRAKQALQLLAQEITNPNLKDTVFKLNSVTKQRDFFESEYRRVLRELHRRDILLSSRMENNATIAELQKEIAELTFQSQGEITRLNQLISTQELEISGLKNLRNVLEAEVGKLKNIKTDYQSANVELARLEAENINLKNKVDAGSSLLKSTADEFERTEAEYQSKLRELAKELQVTRQQLEEVSNSGNTRFVLATIENERLHGVISNLYERINYLEEQQKNNTESQRTEVERLKGLIEQQKRLAEVQLKDSQARLLESEFKAKNFVAEYEKLKGENAEFIKDVNHWKDRYKMIESSHKYLVDAVEKMRTNNVVDVSVMVGTKNDEGVALDAKNMLREANHYKEKAFNLEKRTILLMIEIERLQSMLSNLMQQANGFNSQ